MDHFASDPVLLGLIRAKCIPILLYGIESCPLLRRQISSLEFSLTRILMRIFRTNLSAKQCQVNFGILPIEFQVEIRTARFLQKFTGSQNHLCLLFARCATTELNDMCSKYGKMCAQRHISVTSSLIGFTPTCNRAFVIFWL